MQHDDRSFLATNLGLKTILLFLFITPHSMVKISIVRDKDGFDLGVARATFLSLKKFQSLDRIGFCGAMHSICPSLARQHWALPPRTFKLWFVTRWWGIHLLHSSTLHIVPLCYNSLLVLLNPYTSYIAFCDDDRRPNITQNEEVISLCFSLATTRVQMSNPCNLRAW